MLRKCAKAIMQKVIVGVGKVLKRERGMIFLLFLVEVFRYTGRIEQGRILAFDIVNSSLIPQLIL